MIHIAPDGTRLGEREWRIDVGDRLLVALLTKADGSTELNSGLAFFPLDDASDAEAVAQGRIRSMDPAAQSIGATTLGLGEDQLVQLVDAATNGVEVGARSAGG